MKFKLTVETLTPLHIGTGTDLLKDHDYISISEAGRSATYILDQGAIYTNELVQRGGSARLNVPAGRLISPGQLYEGSPFVRYQASGATVLEQIHEQIKDGEYHCYIPGSSLKGAFRSALLAYAKKTKALAEGKVHYEKNLKNQWVKESAASELERIAFRGADDDPNHDLLRALQVSDTNPLGMQPPPLEVSNVRVFTGGDTDTPIAVEAIQSRLALQSSLTIDELILQFSAELGWRNYQLNWLLTLPEILQSISLERILAEAKTAEEKGFDRTLKFYQRLEKLARQLKGTNGALLQLGWGTGWTGMTIGSWLAKEERDEARTKFQLGKPPTQRGAWEPDLKKPFPKGRRLRSIGKNTPDLPFGWVAVTFEPEGYALNPEKWQARTIAARAAFERAESDQNGKTTARPSVKLDDAITRASASIDSNEDQGVHLKSPEASKPALNTKATVDNQDPVIQSKLPAPAASPFIDRFTAIPKVGDRFMGEIYDPDWVYVEIPGLDLDEQAYAYIPKVEVGKLPPDNMLPCEVIALQKDGKVWRVRCKPVVKE